jgi:hypothetical protein
MKYQLYCELCRECIGTFDSEEVEEPITGAMFHSKDARHGFPPPFRSPSLSWEDMRCPYCNNRPFLERGFLLTERGHWSTISAEFVHGHGDGTQLREIATQRLHERPAFTYDDDIRARIDADRMPPPTEKLPMYYGPDAPVTPDLEEEPVVHPGELDVQVESEESEKQGYLDMTPDQKAADISRRMELDEAEDGGEDGDSGHDRSKAES